MKAWIMSLVFLPLSIFAQEVAKLYPHQKTADSIVTYFLGPEIFQRYTQFDAGESKLTANGTFFQYNFRHPSFSGHYIVIGFTLDSKGQLIPNTDTRGLVRIDTASNGSRWIDARQAIDICRQQAHHIKKRSLRLTWTSTNTAYDTYRKTGNYRDIVAGQMHWEVDGVVKFRGDRYRGTFKVDVLTGTIAKHFAIPWD